MEFHQTQDLTARELLVLEMFSKGMLREDVASELQISVKTLRVYLTKIYSKLSIKKLHQAVVWYLVHKG